MNNVCQTSPLMWLNLSELNLETFALKQQQQQLGDVSNVLK